VSRLKADRPLLGRKADRLKSPKSRHSAPTERVPIVHVGSSARLLPALTLSERAHRAIEAFGEFESRSWVRLRPFAVVVRSSAAFSKALVHSACPYFSGSPQVRSLIIMGIVGIITVGWSFINHRRPPHRVLGASGTISPGKVSALIVTVIGIGVFGLGLKIFLYGDLGVGLLCAAVGFALALFMAPSLTHMHDLSWDDAGVEGPSRLFGPALGLSRTSIHWNDIGTVGATITSFWFVQSSDGRRVYWSYLYPGYGSFTARLRVKRPDLTFPNDLG